MTRAVAAPAAGPAAGPTAEQPPATPAEEAEALGRSLLALAERLRGDGAWAPDAAAPSEPRPESAEASGPAPPEGALPVRGGSSGAPPGQPPSDPAALRQTVVGLQTLRQRRLRHLGLALAGEAAWDILLSLYEAMLARRELTVRQLTALSNAYPATVQRWLVVLAGLGLIELPGPDQDPTRQRARLTRKGEQAMTDCLRGLLPAR